MLFGQHDSQWIEPGRPGEGNILIFNNGSGRPGTDYSSVDEIVTPVDAGGNYSIVPGSAYLPAAPTWSYTAPNPPDFYGDHISGAQRLPSGNTLICEGPSGTFFEVTAQKAVVWQYVNSYPSPQQNGVFKIRRYPHYLWADGETLSAAAAGTVNFSIEAGSDNANRTCLLVGSASGDTPGTLLPGGQATIPLNRDWFTDFVLPRLNTPMFTGFYASLDGSGSGTAALNTFGPLPGVIPVGSSLHFAFALAGPWDFVSNSLEIEIVP